MDEFSYLSVLLSVVLGLAVTQILKGFRGLVLSRAHVRLYWPVIGWAVLVLLVCFQNWWSMFGMRNRHGWTFGFAPKDPLPHPATPGRRGATPAPRAWGPYQCRDRSGDR
jgi:hypothetical protein